MWCAGLGVAGYMESGTITKCRRSRGTLSGKPAPGCLQCIAAYLMLLATPAALGQNYISPNVPVVRCNLTPVACLSGGCRDQELLA